ncbi:unnamed protein product [Rotaria socialis]
MENMDSSAINNKLNDKSMVFFIDCYFHKSRRTPTEGNSECDTCCNMLLERMFNCPPCRYFVLNNRRQGSSCFCTICFKQNRHRRRHHLQENEQLPSSRFDG